MYLVLLNIQSTSLVNLHDRNRSFTLFSVYSLKIPFEHFRKKSDVDSALFYRKRNDIDTYSLNILCQIELCVNVLQYSRKNAQNEAKN